MANTYEILDGETVINTIIASVEFVASHYPGKFRLIEESAQAATPFVLDERLWWIDIGPFVDRFGAQKYPILASVDATVRALIQDVSWRKYLDLKRADLPTMFDILIAKGFAIDKTAILTTHTTESERHIKNLPEVWS